MRPFLITLGNPAPEGTDYGTFEGATPEDAVLAALHDADWSREYAAPELLSTSPDYGRGARTQDGNGTGAACRDDWWYVTDATTGQLAGIYTVAEAERRA